MGDVSVVGKRAAAFLLAVVTAVPAGATCVSPVLSEGLHAGNAIVDRESTTRQYDLYLGSSYAAASANGRKPVPLVVDLHGLTATATAQRLISHWDDMADAYGFVVVYPNGKGRSWNGYSCCGDARTNHYDDLGFLRDLVARVSTQVNVDHRRIYVTGISNGAAMTYRGVCEAADLFAAGAAFSMDMALPDPQLGITTCQPSRPMALHAVRGYQEGPSVISAYCPGNFYPTFPGAQEGFTQKMAPAMGCTGTPTETVIQPSGTQVACYAGSVNMTTQSYDTCADGVTVKLTNLDAGHVGTYGGTNTAVTDGVWQQTFAPYAMTLPDADADGVADVDDNCPSVANPDQADANADCVGDVCQLCGTPSEQCDGGACCTAGCTLVPAGTTCRPSAGTCDVMESCDGIGGACPVDAFVAASVVCRASAGDCDVAEQCSGSSAACPVDGFAPASAVCRIAAGDCDVAEHCTGSGVACPADGFAGASVVCRAAAGDCDVAETCSGSSVACPSDGVAPSTTVCRSASGLCDAVEHCDGVSAVCPADLVRPAGTECRAAANACDVPELCSGTSAACPPAETSGGDGTGCDNCPGVPNPGQEDADADGVGDACDPCTNVVPVLATSAKLAVQKLDRAAGQQRLAFKGTLTNVPLSPTIDPRTKGARIVIGAASGPAVVDVLVPPGAFDVGTGTGWRANGTATSFTYLNPFGVSGITKVVIKWGASTPSTVKFTVAGKNGSFAVGALPLSGTLVLDAPLATSGQCGEARFAGARCAFNGNASKVTCK